MAPYVTGSKLRAEAKRVLTPIVRCEVLLRADFRCAYCKRAGTRHADPDGGYWQMDHIVPLCRGGSIDWETNVAPACVRCNQFKGTMLVDEMHAHLRVMMEALGAEG